MFQRKASLLYQTLHRYRLLMSFSLADYRNLYHKCSRSVARLETEGRSDFLPAAGIEIRSFAHRLGIELSGVRRNAADLWAKQAYSSLMPKTAIGSLRRRL